MVFRAVQKDAAPLTDKVLDVSNARWTAAQRTLPMGSLIVVTESEDGRSRGAMSHQSDRGPFVGDRMIDLERWLRRRRWAFIPVPRRCAWMFTRPPKPINTGGRWCVQIGAFHKQRDAEKLKERLLKLYPGRERDRICRREKVTAVRIRPQWGDDRDMAEYIAQHTQPSEGNAYLTRLD